MGLAIYGGVLLSASMKSHGIETGHIAVLEIISCYSWTISGKNVWNGDKYTNDVHNIYHRNHVQS